MLGNLAEPRRRQIGNGLLALLSIAAVGAVWGTAVRIQESMDEGRDSVRRAGLAIAESIDHDIDVHASHLQAMRYLAERLLAGDLPGKDNPLARMRPTPAGNGYESLPAPGTDLTAVGRITGSGRLPDSDDPIALEMAMAEGLAPIMRAVKERSRDVPWVQYASARQFMLIFPFAGAEDFQFTPALLTRAYFAEATPEANPQRRMFWSAPYDDAAGRGRIVTVTQPIYRESTFLGSVSIDVLVRSLQRHLEAVPIPRTHVHVVRNSDGQIIAQAWPHEDDTSHQGHEVIVLPLRSAPWSVELRIDEGELLKAALSGRMWHISAVLVMAVALVFVVLLTRSHRRVRAMAITDGLTGLYNRRFFDRIARHQLDTARRQRRRLCLALLDIDYFKKYNDRYGHQAGDEALRRVAGAIQQTLRRATDLVFRVGGEEFAVLFCPATAGPPGALLEAINAAVRALEIPHAEHPAGRVTVSIGAVLLDPAHDGGSIDDGYKRADESLYAAKEGGRDRLVIAGGADASA